MAGRLIVTPHAVTLEGQRNLPADLLPGETLYSFLHRHIEGFDPDAWTVSVGGRNVPSQHLCRIFVKPGQIIEARSDVGRTAVALVATLALAYFTMGAGALITTSSFGGIAAGTAYAINAGIFIAGATIINKVLTPKTSSSSSSSDSVYSLDSASNSARVYEPLGIVFGTVKVTPDIISTTYTWYEGNDQYMGLMLSPGINVNYVDALYIGDTLITEFDNVNVYYNNFPGMVSQDIPLYSNVDTTDGAELSDDASWTQRTTSTNTIAIMINLEYVLGGTGTSGKNYQVSETVDVQYCLTGTDAWQSLVTKTYTRSDQSVTYRDTLTVEVAEGQYDVRVRIRGDGNYSGSNTQTNDFTWSTMGSVQPDDASYAGIPRIGIKIKATGQISSNVDAITCVAHAMPIPVWDGTQWITQETSNAAAHALQFARGIYDENGTMIAGVGLSDDMIDIDKIKAFMVHCTENSFNYDYRVTSARSRIDMLNAFAAVAMGEFTPSSGALSVIWAADDQPLTGMVNMGTITKASFQVDYTLSNSADGIEYTYYSSEDWSTKTLRVVDPTVGYESPLNPTQISGEGVTNADHAAKLARWHLAQSLYQYKSISYTQDLEYLSYRRFGLLALQHDMTQWGYGGRIRNATVVDGAVVLTLDDTVPAPSSGNAYIGLRIPGELVYRVFQVKAFVADTNTVTLLEDWPDDAEFPGVGDDNPAWDTTWIYDFKSTPGYRVRVTSITPASDFGGAQIECVPESDELWDYVNTGTYVPAPNQSLLQTRPIASNLKVAEVQVVQGDTVFTELVATFDVSGYASSIIVQSDLNMDGELEQVATTTTRTARWRIPGAGTYSVIVRPYGKDGIAGVAASTTYTTIGTGGAPVNVDYFEVTEKSGGVRKYSWSFSEDTIQSADFAGVEVRYIAGSIASPVWGDMTPLGEDGFHTAAFESVDPVAGSWTFAVRARNTSGTLSNTMLTVQKVLSENLGEIIVGVNQQLSDTEASLVERIADIDLNAETIIKLSVAQYKLNNESRQNYAYISRVDKTYADETQALAESVETLVAATDENRAAVQQVSTALSTVEGKMEASWTLQVQIDQNGNYYAAGIKVGTYSDGEVVQSEILMLADRFAVMSEAGGLYYFPFQVVSGVVYMNSAIIQDGSITNAKIGEYIQSENYVWDDATATYSGWRIDKDGTAQFAGDVSVRGTVYSDKLVGTLQRVVTVDWTGSVSGGASSLTELVQISMPEPVADGQTHVPVMQLSVTCNPTGDSAGETYFRVQRLVSGSWVTVKSYSLAAGSSIAIHHSVTTQMPETSVAETYRLAVQDKSNGARLNVIDVSGVVTGIK